MEFGLVRIELALTADVFRLGKILVRRSDRMIITNRAVTFQNRTDDTFTILAASSPIIAAFVAWASAGQRPSRGVLIGLAFVLPGGLLVGVDWTAAGARIVLTGGELFVLLGIASWSW